MSERLKVNPISPDWAIIKRWAEAKRESARRLLEDVNCPEGDGHRHRGVIATCNDLLTAVEGQPAKPTIPDGGPSYT